MHYSSIIILLFLTFSSCTYHSQNQGNKASDAKVYPNPATTEFFVQYNSCKAGNIVMKDINGNEVLSQKLPSGNRTQTIDISKLQVSMFIYKIWFDTSDIAVGKLIKVQ
jgi:Secretion system C-terminal sorting domain